MPSSSEISICKKKTRFSSDAAARMALNKVRPGWGIKKPSRVYKCPVCRGWHLTSKPRR